MLPNQTDWQISEDVREEHSRISREDAQRHAERCKVPMDVDGHNWSWKLFFTTGDGFDTKVKKD